MVPRWRRTARLHEVPAHRADQAALLASAAWGMQRIGIAWDLGAPAELLLERACTSLAAAGLSPDGVGPLLGGRSALR